jgi:osmoprotectant transport system ATP-binding protein
MIEFNQVYKSYDANNTQAVDGLSLQIHKGELLGLIGESGCGKTTTLKLINRLEEPTSGTVTVNGEDVQAHDPVALRRNIGYVFQGIGLFPHRTVEQNVAAVPELLGWDTEKIKLRCQVILDMVGLDYSSYKDRRPLELSGGQQQRVGVARALAAEPELMLMDEPFGALDPVTRAELQDEFKKIQKQFDLTVVMVTHDMTEALLLADRIAVMKDGRILQIGTPHELLTNPQHEYVSELVEMPKRRTNLLEQLMKQNSI